MGLNEAILAERNKPAFERKEIPGIGTVFIKRLKAEAVVEMAGEDFFPSLVAASVHDAVKKGETLAPEAEPYFSDAEDVKALPASIYRALFAEANSVNWVDTEAEVDAAGKGLTAIPSPAS